MSPARTRRTLAAVVTVWVLGLLLVLGLWQRVEATCGDETTVPVTECAMSDLGGSPIG